LTEADVYQCFPLIMISVCGDDSLGTIPCCSLERQQQFCKDMGSNIAMFGFEAKLQVSTKLYDAVYLGMRPYPTRKGWFWGKTIGRATYKMGWVLDKDQDLMAHMTGVADMHVLCSAHVPILADLAKKIVELREGKKRTPAKLDQNRPWEWTLKSGVPYDELTIQAVADIYTTYRTKMTTECNVVDIHACVDQIHDLIRQIQNIEVLPATIDSPFWREMIWCDDL